MAAAEPSTQLPDDIEQRLLDGQRLRATYDLMIRRSITHDNACLLVARWLFERRQDRAPHVGDGQPRA